MAELVPSIIIRKSDQCKQYRLSSNLLILPDEIRDKIFKLIPMLGQIAIIMNDSAISQILMPYNQERLPVYNITIDVIYRAMGVMNILYGNILPDKGTWYDRLIHFCGVQTRYSYVAISDSSWYKNRCMRCRPCIIINIQIGLSFMLEWHLRYGKKDICIIYDILYQLIKQHKVNLIDLYTCQYSHLTCVVCYSSNIRNKFSFEFCNQVDIYNIMRIYDLLIHNHSEAKYNREVGLEPNSRELYFTLTEILQHSVQPDAKPFPELINVIPTYIASKLKYPLGWIMPRYYFSDIGVCDSCMCGDTKRVGKIITTKYLLYHFKRLCPETITLITNIVKHMLIYHTSTILANSIVKHAISNRGLDLRHDVIYNLIIDKYKELYGLVISSDRRRD